MKQILQNPRSGELVLAEVPAPLPGTGQLLVRNHFSVVSPGTEKQMLDFAHQSILSKARSRPDLAKQVLRKLRHDGPLPTYRAAMARLDALQPLGYSSAGVVESIGANVVGFRPGDRVACAGAGSASHAEFVVVPENLAARVPEGVRLDCAAFATVGAVAIQALRVAAPSLGEVGVVIGLGLIGQIAVQLLRANGCRVLGIDLDPVRVKQALDQGAEWAYAAEAVPEVWKERATQGYGADFALVTAAASDAAPIRQAAALCRLKGRVVLTGMMPIELERRTFYEKELELRMSTSYGPGRYDRRFEELGLDYPLPYVRWTENRNLQSFLELLASGSLAIQHLDRETVGFERAVELYAELTRGRRSSLAIVFRYDAAAEPRRRIRLDTRPRAEAPRDTLGVGLVGAGAYAKGMLLPCLRRHKEVRRTVVVTGTGASARSAAQRFGFSVCATEPEAAFNDSDTSLVFIATRHDTHADLAERAIRAGKAVWLEKPLGLSREEVDHLLEVVAERRAFLTVGYNRRFSPHARAIRAAFEGRKGPLAIHQVVAAGPPPRGTWLMDPQVGGGRILGEVCHFVDLCTYLVGQPPVRVFSRALGPNLEVDDSLVTLLSFPDGSTATIEYLAHASPKLPKERVEVSGEGRTARCENYRVTTISGRKSVRTLNQDKGQSAAISETLAACRTGRASPFRLEELAGVSHATFAILDSIQCGQAVSLKP